MMIPGRPAGTPVSGKALPAHKAGQRGTPVSGEALPAHEAGQRGTPVSGKVLPAHEAISEGGAWSLCFLSAGAMNDLR